MKNVRIWLLGNNKNGGQFARLIRLSLGLSTSSLIIYNFFVSLTPRQKDCPRAVLLLYSILRYFPNKSACVPVAVAERISSSLIIWYIRSQSGSMWHSLKSFRLPTSWWSWHLGGRGMFLDSLSRTETSLFKSLPRFCMVLTSCFILFVYLIWYKVSPPAWRLLLLVRTNRDRVDSLASAYR